jgi:hypothetical protein
MENSDEPNFIQIIINLISAYFKRLNDLIHLAGLEARLAVSTFVTIIVLFFILFVLSISTWLCILYGLFIFLVALHFTWLFSAAMLILLNLALIVATVSAILKMKNNLFFPATRKYIYLESTEQQGIKNEQTAKTN